jgi:HlyD family secretion protein
MKDLTMQMTVRLSITLSLLFCLSGLVLLSGCNREPSPGWQGYAEGDYTYVAVPRSGRLVELAVHKGDTVKAGDLLFRLDPEPEATAVAEARKRLAETQFLRDDLATGDRPSELEALEARREQARAARELAQSELDRHEMLFPDGAISKDQLDRSRANLRQRQAELDELDASLVTARLGGRIDQRRAMSASAEAAAEALRQAEWNLAQKSPVAARDALVFDTLFEPGELVPSGTPVVVLLPPEARKARFYVPEPQLSGLQLGGKVRLHFDGGEMPATINYIAPQAEYTPPVIYSRETREKLVYLVEAHPALADAEKLVPGQPLEVVAE